ncbi:MAG: hypothetical protein ACTSXH_00375 [Promethearchaeota archaeon]
MIHHNSEKDEKEIEAIKLIDKAEELVAKGKGEEAINMYEKAAQIYLNLGSYIKLDQLFIRIIDIISQFKNKIQAIYRLKSIIRKTEKLNLKEISARLLIQLGNISFNMKDWEVAGESWRKASEYLQEEDPEEYRDLSSLLLLKAGQVLERSSIKRDLGKRLILKGVMRKTKFEEQYEMEENRALTLLEMKEFEAAAKKFLGIAKNFEKSLKNIDNLIDDQYKDTILTTKARFIHFVAEYQTVAALCLRAAKDREYNDQIKSLGKSSIELFKKSISLLKEYLLKIKNEPDFDKELILRITFDTMLIEITQEMLGEQIIKPLGYLLENSKDHEILIRKLKESPYYKISERIESVGIPDTLDKLLETNLGHFEKIKNTLISYFM